MTRLRIAVIGAGGIARGYHLPSLQQLSLESASIELSAVCDLDRDRAESAARRFGFARAFGDYRVMLDAVAPDAVWALVPTPAIREVAGYLLERQVPTLMEKPPGASSDETRALIDIAAASGTPHQVAFNRRHAPLMLRMKELLAQAGPISATSCQFYRHHRTESHFAYGTGLHGLDALRFLGDGEVVEVVTRPGIRGSAQITLVYESGACGTMEMLPQVGVQSERYTAHAGGQTLVVDGMIGWLTAFPGFLHRFQGGKLCETVEGADLTQATPHMVSGFYGESAHFIRCLIEKRAPSPDLAHSLRSVQIAEAVDRGQGIVFGP